MGPKVRRKMCASFSAPKGAGGGFGFNPLSQVGSLGADFVLAIEVPTPAATRNAVAYIGAAEGALAAGIEVTGS